MGAWLKSNWAYLMWVGIIALLLAYCRDMKTLQQRGKYTVGYLGGWVETLKNGRSFDYTYAVNGTTYRGSGAEKGQMNTDRGAQYLVEFDSLKPSTSVVYFDYPLADSSASPPPAGWDKKAYNAREDSLKAAWQQDSLQKAMQP